MCSFSSDRHLWGSFHTSQPSQKLRTRKHHNHAQLWKQHEWFYKSNKHVVGTKGSEKISTDKNCNETFDEFLTKICRTANITSDCCPTEFESSVFGWWHDRMCGDKLIFRQLRKVLYQHELIQSFPPLLQIIKNRKEAGGEESLQGDSVSDLVLLVRMTWDPVLGVSYFTQRTKTRKQIIN